MKIKIPNLVDVSKFLKTNSGQDLKEFIEYVASSSDEIVTAIQGNLTYGDNFLSEIKNIGVRHDTEEVVRLGRNDRVSEVRVRRIYDDAYYVVDSFGWKYDAQGNLVIKCLFQNPFDPIPIPESLIVQMDVIIYYG